MNFLSRSLAVAALVVASASVSAAVVLSATNVSGDVRLSEFGNIGVGGALPNTGTFTADLKNLSGHVDFTPVPNGYYTVSAQATGSLTGFGPSTIPVNLPDTPIFNGSLSSPDLGLTPLAFNFGTPIGTDVVFGFSIDYDGNASTQLINLLTGVGLPFPSTAGSGTLGVSGKLFADGTTVKLTFTESNLGWVGFANAFAITDNLYGGNNGAIDGSFAFSSATLSAVPEPATLSLMGLSLVGLAYSRRRRNAA